MKQLGRWRRSALGMLGLATAACAMDTGSKPAGDAGGSGVEETGGDGDSTGGTSGLGYLTGGTSALPAGGSMVTGGRATGGMRASGGMPTGPRTCNCSCFCGSCSGETTSGPTTKSCSAGDATCVDCAAPCRAFCSSIACTLMTLASGSCS